MGAEQDWCKEVGKRLQESKLYFKTTYRNHCSKDDCKCADHCRVFALSYAVDTDFQRVCSHNAVTLYFLKVSVISHKGRCMDCEKLESVLEVVRGATSGYTMQLQFFEVRWSIYNSRLGNEAHSDEVLGKASGMVYQEGNQLVCE